jgi:hypothetical protein
LQRWRSGADGSPPPHSAFSDTDIRLDDTTGSPRRRCGHAARRIRHTQCKMDGVATVTVRRKRAKTDGEKRPRSRLASPCKELLLVHIKHTYRYGAVWFPVVDLRGRFEYCFKRDATSTVARTTSCPPLPSQPPPSCPPPPSGPPLPSPPPTAWPPPASPPSGTAPGR